MVAFWLLYVDHGWPTTQRPMLLPLLMLCLLPCLPPAQPNVITTTVGPMSISNSWSSSISSLSSLSSSMRPPQRMWDPDAGMVLGQGVGGSLDNVIITNVTTQLGQPVFLRCPMRNVAEKKKVSWIRRRDYHLLTSGTHTYSSDDRFTLVQEGRDWSLRIKFVQQRDQGEYECQVSTSNGRYGYLVGLTVVVPEAHIIGQADMHLQAGSTITLTCIIRKSLSTPKAIMWLHSGRLINYDKGRQGVHLTQDNRTSTLTISDASYHDAGNYSCTAPQTMPDTLQVFVSQGDKTAAIQRFGSTGKQSSVPGSCIFLAIAVNLYTIFTDTQWL
ncbi:unnamed protein product [Meganyctiphanes norvegica]|uniref:Ig-like domain-containing protein n=1 Tax=Meganyctiphanes norvegica TaxID=48144 RepID=A0AAV2PLV1_MEGNR